MRGVNQVTLLGTLGADPETRYTADGTCITTARMATNEQWTDKVSGEKKERTEWHRVQFFGRLGEIAGEYLKKGRAAFVQGQLRTDKYTDKDGVERYTTSIRASELQLLGGRDSGGDGQAGGGESSRAPRAPRTRGSAPARTGTPAAASAPNQDTFDDADIPF